jgi:hypothetical protein
MSGAGMERGSPGVSLVCDLPRSYLEAVERLAARQGWRIEQQGSKFYLRSVEPLNLRRRSADDAATPSNHLPFFNSLNEVHAFLTGK